MLIRGQVDISVSFCRQGSAACESIIQVRHDEMIFLEASQQAQAKEHLSFLGTCNGQPAHLSL